MSLLIREVRQVLVEKICRVSNEEYYDTLRKSQTIRERAFFQLRGL